MKLQTVIILMVGGVLVYSAVADKSPLAVLKLGLQGKTAPRATPPTPPATPSGAAPSSGSIPATVAPVVSV